MKFFTCEDNEDITPNTVEFTPPSSALVKCPECGKDISKKAKRCVHCGKILNENTSAKLFCSDCGKEIPTNAAECPYCGCPVEDDTPRHKPINNKIIKIIKKHSVPIIVIAIIVVIISVIITYAKSSLNEDEQLAYQNAVSMQNMMRDPDSFRLYDEIFLLKRYDDEGNLDYTYTIFKYGGANGYGAVTTDEAIFQDGNYVMDYADEPDEDDSNYYQQALVKADLAYFMIVGEGDTWEMVEIDIDKIKKKMGLE